MAAHSVEASGNFLVPNATFIFEFIAFLLILFILAKYVYPYIQGPIQARQALIAKEVEDSEAASKRFAEAEAEYQRALTEARVQAGQIRENARAEAQGIVEELRKSAQEESARIVARGEEQLANQRGAIVRELRGEIGSLAVELSEKIVDERLADDARVSATVDSFLAELERRDATGADSSNGASS
jgi:F-type H+-transporting ATPase subunit b